jgi:hypothetical protein
LENARQLVMRPSERFLPMTTKEQRDAEQAERDYHDPLHHELNYTGDNAAAILAQVTKMERH